MAEKQDLELGEAGKGGGKKKLLIIVGAVVLLLAIAGAAAFFLLGKSPDAEAEAESGEAQEETAEHQEGGGLLYVSASEPILANLPSATKPRTIKVQVVYAVKSPEAELAVKKHLPLLSSILSMQLSSTDAESLMTPEGQQAFRDLVLQNARAALEKEETQPMVERILFTQFVMQ